MIKTKTAALVFLLMLALASVLPPAGPVQAAAPEQFTALGFAWIATPPVGFPAGGSGRYVTTEETVMAALGESEWDLISGAVLEVGHASNARFEVDYSYGFPLITHVESGNSHGKFTLFAANGLQYQGSYQTKISSAPGCTIFDSGTWVLNSGSAGAHGTLSVCLNFTGQTYSGWAIVEGQYN